MTIRLAVVFLTLAAPAAAQLAGTIPRSANSGLVASASVHGASMQFANAIEAQTGVGGGMSVGYGFGGKFMVLASASRAMMQSRSGDFPLSQYDITGRLHIMDQTWRWVPFVEFGFSRFGVEHKDLVLCTTTCISADLERWGLGMASALGVSFYPTRKLAMTASLGWNQGSLGNAKLDGVEAIGFETDATAGRLTLGFTWFPRPR